MNGFAPTVEQINSGEVSFNASFAERSFPQLPADGAGVNVSFATIAGASLGAFNNSPVGSVSSWAVNGFTGTLPDNTRNITYSMFFVRNSGNDLDAFIDNNNLTLSYPGTSWKGAATANWNDPAQWNSGVPVGNAPALFTSASNTASVGNFNGDYSATPLSELYVDGLNSVTLQQNQNSTMAAAAEIIGNIGGGHYVQTAGVNLGGTMFVGYLAGSNGTYSITGGTLNANSIFVAVDATGSLTIGGTANVTVTTAITCGLEATAPASITISNGTLTTPYLELDNNAILNISGGQPNITSLAALSSSARLNLTGGTLTCANLSLTSPANLVWPAGTLHMTTGFNFDTLGANVNLTLGEILTSDISLNFGTASSTLNRLSGGLASAPTVTIASGINNTLSIENTSSTLTTTNLYVGGSSSGPGANGTLSIKLGNVTTTTLTVFPNSGFSPSAAALITFANFAPGSFSRVRLDRRHSSLPLRSRHQPLLLSAAASASSTATI